MTITRLLEFDAGHRLLKHESKCRNVHGHRYKVEVTCSAAKLDDVGRVIDFSAIKTKVGGWIDEFWDHGFIAQKGDPILPWLGEQGMKCYIMATPPTAEHMSEYLLARARELLVPEGIEVTHVRLYETPNCWSDAQ